LAFLRRAEARHLEVLPEACGRPRSRRAFNQLIGKASKALGSSSVGTTRLAADPLGFGAHGFAGKNHPLPWPDPPAWAGRRSSPSGTVPWK
jgi:hypothetical protein